MPVNPKQEKTVALADYTTFENRNKTWKFGNTLTWIPNFWARAPCKLWSDWQSDQTLLLLKAEEAESHSLTRNDPIERLLASSSENDSGDI